MERPQRSPLEIPELVKDYIIDKSFCEIGCAEGDLLEMFAQYATVAYGIEQRDVRWPNLQKIADRNDNIIISKSDVFQTGLPNVDTYFIWTKPRIDKHLFALCPAGSTVISYKTKANRWWLEECYKEIGGKTEWISFVSNEDIEPYEAGDMRTGELVMITKDTEFIIGILHK